MTTAQDLLKGAWASEVVPVLRSRGFKGSWPTWRLTNERGDVAIVNVQGSMGSDRTRAAFYLNLAFAPSAWLEWRSTLGTGPVGKSVHEYHGLWRDRLEPASGLGHWSLTDAASAAEAVREVLHLLDREGLPAIEPLLDRAVLLQTIRTGNLGHIDRSFDAYYATAEAVIVADAGNPAELEDVLARVPGDEPPRSFRRLGLTAQPTGWGSFLAA